MTVLLCLFCAPTFVDAKIQNDLDVEGMQNFRSIESLRDLDYQTWQVVVYQKDNKIVLRIVGFPGSLRIDHPKFLAVEAGIKAWNLEDITLQNSELSNDSREAAAEFELQELLLDLQNNRPLRLSLSGAFNELPIPPYVVKEWRSFLTNSAQNG